jgi:hypothetical protein
MDEVEASHLRQQVSRLITERHGLEKVLMERQRLLRGSLLERPKFCGKPGCKCTRGEPHPPGLYLSRRVGDTARHLFIRSADHERASREALSYKEFRQALRRWRGIDDDLDQIWEALGQAREENYPFE